MATKSDLLLPIDDLHLVEYGYLYKGDKRRKLIPGLPRNQNDPPRVIFHSVEGYSASRKWMLERFYLHHVPPQFWVSFIEVNGHHDTIAQRLGIQHSAYATLHPGGTPETNHMGKFCVQIEVEGYAKSAHLWPDSMLVKLGCRVLGPICQVYRENGFPDFTPQAYRDVGLPKEQSWTATSPSRMTDKEWKTCIKADGTPWNVCMHSEVPDNWHHDMAEAKLGVICWVARQWLLGRTEAAILKQLKDAKASMKPAENPTIKLPKGEASIIPMPSKDKPKETLAHKIKAGPKPKKPAPSIITEETLLKGILLELDKIDKSTELIRTLVDGLD